MFEDRLERIKVLIEECPAGARQQLVEVLRYWLDENFLGYGIPLRQRIGERLDVPLLIPDPLPEPRPRNPPIPRPIMDGGKSQDNQAYCRGHFGPSMNRPGRSLPPLDAV